MVIHNGLLGISAIANWAYDLDPNGLPKKIERPLCSVLSKGYQPNVPTNRPSQDDFTKAIDILSKYFYVALGPKMAPAIHAAKLQISEVEKQTLYKELWAEGSFFFFFFFFFFCFFVCHHHQRFLAELAFPVFDRAPNCATPEMPSQWSRDSGWN